ncbi:MAG: hypothetical protein JRE23_16635 [Deltaproteobacteria bacterium]|nr:hypothetical protein [Deltaproteobacteria bacterium]
MPDDANVDIILCIGLLPEEERKLRDIGNDVLRVLLDRDIDARPLWICRTNNKNRTIILRLPNNQIVFELPASELADLTHDKLLSRLNESMDQQ